MRAIFFCESNNSKKKVWCIFKKFILQNKTVLFVLWLKKKTTHSLSMNRKIWFAMIETYITKLYAASVTNIWWPSSLWLIAVIFFICPILNSCLHIYCTLLICLHAGLCEGYFWMFWCPLIQSFTDIVHLWSMQNTLEMMISGQNRYFSQWF